jgi:hypothetical protein
MVTLKDFLCLIENTKTKVSVFEETDKPKDLKGYLSNLIKEPGDVLKGSMTVFKCYLYQRKSYLIGC